MVNALHNIAKAIVVSLPVKIDNYYYCKVGRGIALWGAIKKSQILLSLYWNNEPIESAIKIISYFGAPRIF